MPVCAGTRRRRSGGRSSSRNFNLTWLEEPLHPDNLQGYARLQRQAPMRIAAGEEICDIKEFQQMMDVGGIDVVAGGRRRASAAWPVPSASAGIPSSGIACASITRTRQASTSPPRLHFVAALPNTHYFEYCVEQGALRQTLTKQRFPGRDGDICVPEEPGLGIDLDEAVVQRYRVA